MKTSAIIATIVVLLGIGLVAAYFMDRDSGPSGPNATTTSSGSNNSGSGNSGNDDEDKVVFETSMVRVFAPAPNSAVSSPLRVRGEARGNWFFEASFPVRLLDASGKQLAIGVAQAQGEWMTTNFVPFEATLTFANPGSGTGTLILEKDNPSGLPENAAEVRIPVRFSSSASMTPIQDAIRALLAKWNLPGVELVGANLVNGVLTLEFKDPQFQTSGGSARVLAMREEIETTAKKFSGVTSVRIIPSDVFQP